MEGERRNREVDLWGILSFLPLHEFVCDRHPPKKRGERGKKGEGEGSCSPRFRAIPPLLTFRCFSTPTAMGRKRRGGKGEEGGGGERAFIALGPLACSYFCSLSRGQQERKGEKREKRS